MGRFHRPGRREDGGPPLAMSRSLPYPTRPAYGHSKDGHDELKQVLLSLGVRSDGLPLRVGVRENALPPYYTPLNVGYNQL